MANDVEITLINKTGKPQTFVVFQQEPDIDKIFTEVFPTAWRVFKVGATDGRGFVVLPIQYQIAAGDMNSAFTGHVSNIQDTDTGKNWTYSVNNAGSYELLPKGDQSDGSIACLNETGGYVTMSLAKSELPLLTYPEVGDGANATFKPTSYIYIAWYNNIVQGAKISASISQPQALGINLDGAKDIKGTLTKDPAGRLTWDLKVNGIPVNPLANALGLKPAMSVTESVMEAMAAVR